MLKDFKEFAMKGNVVDMAVGTPETPAASTTKDCAYCLMAIPIKAQKCGHCSSDVRAAS